MDILLHSARRRRALVRQWAFPGTLVVAALIVVTTTLSMAAGLQTSLPRSDQWTFVADLRDAHRSFDLFDLFRQQNENRPVLPRLLQFADYEWLGGQNQLTVAVAWLVQAAHLALFGAVASAALEGRAHARARGSAVVATAAVLFFSAAQLRTFEWGFQVQPVVGFALATGCFACAWRSSEADSTRRARWAWQAGAIGCALVAEFTFEGGILTWPLLVILTWLLRGDRREAVAVAAIGVVAVTLYFVDYTHPPFASTPIDAAGVPLDVLTYFLAYLGNPAGAWGDETSVVAGAAGIAVAIYAFASLWRTGSRRAELVIAAIAVFAACEALLVAVQRADFSAAQATSSSLVVGPSVWWAALFAIVWIRAEDFPQRFAVVARPLVAVMAIAIVAFAVRAAATIPDDFAAAHDTYPGAEAALLAGVYDRVALSAIYPPESVDALIALVPFLQREGYSVFSGRDDGELIGQHAEDAFVYVLDDGCTGFLDAIVPADGTAGGVVAGWSWISARSGGFDRLVIVSADGVIQGVARGGYPRPDVPEDERRIDRDDVGWRGFVRPGAGEVYALGVFGDGGACRLQGTQPAP